MKNLTFILLLMISSSVLSQHSKVYVYVNVDSANIILDEINQGIALKGLPMILKVKKGEHEIIAQKGSDSFSRQTFRLRKNDSIQVFCTSRNNQTKPKLQEVKEEPVFLVVEEPATFNGNDLSSFHKWVSENLKYPESLFQKGCGGKLYVQFIVNATGNVENANILAGFNNEFDQEAVRVITSSPLWGPAKQGGRAVKQLFTIPIIFNPWPKK